MKDGSEHCGFTHTTVHVVNTRAWEPFPEFWKVTLCWMRCIRLQRNSEVTRWLQKYAGIPCIITIQYHFALIRSGNGNRRRTLPQGIKMSLSMHCHGYNPSHQPGTMLVLTGHSQTQSTRTTNRMRPVLVFGLLFMHLVTSHGGRGDVT